VGVLVSIILFSGVEAGDFRAFYHASQLALQGEDFVGVAPPGVTSYASWVYPPIAVLLFIPFALLNNWLAAFVVWNVINIGIAVAIGQSIFNMIQEQNPFVDIRDRILIIACLVIGPPAIFNLVQGQTNFVVLGCIFYGFLAVERGHSVRAGAAYAIAATIKLWPVLFGVWLLYKRDYLSIIAAIIAGIGLQLLGVLLFGIESYVALIEIIVNDRASTGTISLVYLLENIGLSSLSAIIVAVSAMGTVLYVIYKDGPDSPIFKYTATIVAVLLASPSIMQYMIFIYVGSIPTIYLAEGQKTQIRLGLGLFLISIPITRFKIDYLYNIIAGTKLPFPEWTLLVMNVPLWGLSLLLAALYLWSRSIQRHTTP
jgi:hypothetical protein